MIKKKNKNNILSVTGEDVEEVYKPRRWISAGEGPYRLIVSSEAESLDEEESVSLAAAQVKKKRDKPSEEEHDKVTQRIVLKRARKRDRLPSEILNPRKRRRNPAVSTTGLPQTMSYNLYNHFRPLEQDVPQDHLIPFLDFGKKLSTTSSGEGSSTPRLEERDEDHVYHEDMDVTVVRKAVERNSVPRGPIQLKPTHVASSFFSGNSSEPSSSVNKTVIISDNSTNVHNKTDKKDVHYDLQSNESGIKLHAVLSPNYGQRLNRTEKVLPTTTNSPSEEYKEIVSTTEAVNNTTEQPVTEKEETVIPRTEAVSIQEPVSKSNDSDSSEYIDSPVPIPSPKPTARILSTAVVTSVSVKETLPRHPRPKYNNTRSEAFQRLTLKNFTAESSTQASLVNLEPRIRLDNHTLIGLQNARRKLYTTLRPKTTTYRPVTFRSAFRRNITGLGSGVVHIISTPPTYIEVPKIITNSPIRFVNVETRQPPITSTAPTTTTLSTTPPSTTTTTTTAEPTTTETTTSSTTATPSTTTTTTSTTTPPSVTTNSSVITTEGPSIDYPVQTDLGISDEDIRQVENATVHIEFKPLDPLLIPSTSEPSGREHNRRPSLLWIYNQRNHSNVRNQSVGVAYSDSHVGLVTYVLAALALIPLILGLSVLVKQILRKSKKKVN